MKDKDILLVNVYGPNRDTPAFYEELTEMVKEYQNHNIFYRVPGEIKRSRDLRGGRWSWTLTFAQKRS